jgi:hypothetical protein
MPESVPTRRAANQWRGGGFCVEFWGGRFAACLGWVVSLSSRFDSGGLPKMVNFSLGCAVHQRRHCHRSPSQKRNKISHGWGDFFVRQINVSPRLTAHSRGALTGVFET